MTLTESNTKTQTKMGGSKFMVAAFVFALMQFAALDVHGMNSDSRKLLADAKSRAAAELAELQREHQTNLRERIAREEIGGSMGEDPNSQEPERMIAMAPAGEVGR